LEHGVDSIVSTGVFVLMTQGIEMSHLKLLLSLCVVFTVIQMTSSLSSLYPSNIIRQIQKALAGMRGDIRDIARGTYYP